MKNKVSISGNPGIVGAEGLIFYPCRKLETSFSWGVGQLTNNQAKLFALLKACQLAKAAWHNNIQIFEDSEIIIKVLNSATKFNNLSLNVTMQRMHFILIDFVSVSSYHILRNLNKLAYYKANQGFLLPLGMLSLNEGPSSMHPIP